MTPPNGVKAWRSNPSRYIQEFVKTIEEYLGGNFGDGRLQKKATVLFPDRYVTEVDTRSELIPEQVALCLLQIGVLQ